MMGITYEYTYIYTIAILVCKSNIVAQNIHYGNFCLESASNFMDLDNRCTLTETEIQNYLQNANTTCPKTCEFEMMNMKSNGNLGLKFQLIFKNKNETVEACSSPGQSGKFRNLYINCSSWNEDDYDVFGALGCMDTNGQCDRISTICICHCHPGYTMVEKNCIKGNDTLGKLCESDLQCTGTQLATNCSGGRCTCQVEYVPINNTCYQGGLTLNQPCTYDNQCFGFPNVGCLGEKCSCREGYSARDSSACVQIDEFKEYRTDDNNKSLLGAIIGGPLVGVIIVIGCVFLLYKRFRSNNTKRKERAIHFANIDTNRVSDHITPLRENKQENVAAKSVHIYSGEAVEYSHIYDETREALTQDDVYHHLNEEKEQQLDDGNYDHACAAVGHVADLNEYSVITDAKNNTTVTPTEEIDEYFVLEQSVNKDG